jgi:cation:H+ antiporter
MTSAVLQFTICAAVIIVAGTYLTRFADAIADITKLGRLVIGSVLLAGATSLPELTVDISAIRMGLADLAVGDLLGSSLMNLLILAVLDLATRSRGTMLSKQAAAHALSGLVAASLTAVVGLGLLTAKGFAPYTFLGISPAIWVIAVTYFLGVRLVYLDQRMSLRTAAEQGHEPEMPTMSLAAAVSGFGVCALVIVIAGPYLAESAGVIAEQTGLGKTFVGTTLVALSTSLPELVSMIAALRMGATDLAIGNVFGSNAFNMILLVPLDALYRNPEHSGSLLAAVAPGHIVTCMAVILATQVAVMGQLYKVETRIRFIEPDAWLVIAIVLAALAMIYYIR